MSAQTARKIALLASFAAFQLCPMFHMFLSPVIPVAGAFRGVVAASLLSYGVLALAAMTLGRAFCGWLCPGAAVQECATVLGARRMEGRRRYWTKYAVCGAWAALLAAGAIHAGGFHRIDLLYGVEQGNALRSFLFLWWPLLIVVPPSLIFGRWASCHYVCWIAPLMVLASRAPLPSLGIAAAPARCRRCTRCEDACPMSLDVRSMVLAGRMRSDECILCGSCIAACPSAALRFTYSAAPALSAAGRTEASQTTVRDCLRQ
jgi:polyferredoxin